MRCDGRPGVRPRATAGMRRRLVRRRLDRDRIVQSAIGILDRPGGAALTMRSLAEDLGVTAMALYKYFPSKEALLDAVVDRLLGEIQIPAPSRGDWIERSRALASSFHRVLQRHPALAALVAREPALGRSALRLYEAALEILRGSGLEDRRLVAAYGALYSYTLGFTVVQVARRGAAAARRRVDAAARRQGLDEKQARLLHDLRPRTGRYSDEQFAFGLDLLLAGLAERARRRKRPARG